MTLLEKKVDALCRLDLAEDDAAFNAALEELRGLMAESEPITPQQPMRVRIQDVLSQLGVHHGIIGRKHLEDAIELAIERPELLNRITTHGGLYEVVAERNGTIGSRVERTIRHGIETCWLRGDPELHQKFFGNTVDPNKGKPTNREFITTVAQHIQRER